MSNNTTLTKEDAAIYSRLAMWNGDEAYQYANTVDAEHIDYRAMLAREQSANALRKAGISPGGRKELREYFEWRDGTAA